MGASLIQQVFAVARKDVLGNQFTTSPAYTVTPQVGDVILAFVSIGDGGGGLGPGAVEAYLDLGSGGSTTRPMTQLGKAANPTNAESLYVFWRRVTDEYTTVYLRNVTGAAYNWNIHVYVLRDAGDPRTVVFNSATSGTTGTSTVAVNQGEDLVMGGAWEGTATSSGVNGAFTENADIRTAGGGAATNTSSKTIHKTTPVTSTGNISTGWALSSSSAWVTAFVPVANARAPVVMAASSSAGATATADLEKRGLQPMEASGSADATAEANLSYIRAMSGTSSGSTTAVLGDPRGLIITPQGGLAGLPDGRATATGSMRLDAGPTVKPKGSASFGRAYLSAPYRLMAAVDAGVAELDATLLPENYRTDSGYEDEVPIGGGSWQATTTTARQALGFRSAPIDDPNTNVPEPLREKAYAVLPKKDSAATDGAGTSLQEGTASVGSIRPSIAVGYSPNVTTAILRLRYAFEKPSIAANGFIVLAYQVSYGGREQDPLNQFYENRLSSPSEFQVKSRLQEETAPGVWTTRKEWTHADPSGWNTTGTEAVGNGSFFKIDRQLFTAAEQSTILDWSKLRMELEVTTVLTGSYPDKPDRWVGHGFTVDQWLIRVPGQHKDVLKARPTGTSGVTAALTHVEREESRGSSTVTASMGKLVNQLDAEVEGTTTVALVQDLQTGDSGAAAGRATVAGNMGLPLAAQVVGQATVKNIFRGGMAAKIDIRLQEPRILVRANMRSIPKQYLQKTAAIQTGGWNFFSGDVVRTPPYTITNTTPYASGIANSGATATYEFYFGGAVVPEQRPKTLSVDVAYKQLQTNNTGMTLTFTVSEEDNPDFSYSFNASGYNTGLSTSSPFATATGVIPESSVSKIKDFTKLKGRIDWRAGFSGGSEIAVALFGVKLPGTSQKPMAGRIVSPDLFLVSHSTDWHYKVETRGNGLEVAQRRQGLAGRPAGGATVSAQKLKNNVGLAAGLSTTDLGYPVQVVFGDVTQTGAQGGVQRDLVGRPAGVATVAVESLAATKDMAATSSGFAALTAVLGREAIAYELAASSSGTAAVSGNAVRTRAVDLGTALILAGTTLVRGFARVTRGTSVRKPYDVHAEGPRARTTRGGLRRS